MKFYRSKMPSTLNELKTSVLDWCSKNKHYKDYEMKEREDDLFEKYVHEYLDLPNKSHEQVNLSVDDNKYLKAIDIVNQCKKFFTITIDDGFDILSESKNLFDRLRDGDLTVLKESNFDSLVIKRIL